MRKILLRSMVLLLAICMLLPLTVMVFAEGEKNTDIRSVTCKLEISGINSTSKAELTCSTSKSLSITMELQKLKSGSYSTIKTWTATKTGTSLSMEETRLINALCTYRLKVTFTAGSETVIRYAYP